MKYIWVLFFIFPFSLQTFSQSSLPDHFLDGKAVVLISNAPNARPPMDWTELAEKIHPALVEAGGDPIAYYELEEVVLSEEIQAAYARNFRQRLVRNLVLITRKSNGQSWVHILEFSGTTAMVEGQNAWSVQENDLEILNEKIMAAGAGKKTKNLLVLEVPAFLPPLTGGGEDGSGNSQALASGKYLAQNPLNLDVFKLGVPLSGASGESALLTQYRYDLLGKSEAEITAEQRAEKASLENIMEQYYPHQVEFLTAAKSNQELISDRVQFILMRVEGREGDLMESMGLSTENLTDKNRIVVKYYIKFLVRNELYIGPQWDAHPDGQTALVNFLKNLRVQE